MPVDNNKKGSPFFWYDFRVNGKRYRGSTKMTNRGAALKVEAALILKLSNGGTRTKAPFLRELAPRFLEQVEQSRLDDDTKVYYRNGWRILQSQDIACMRIDSITQSTAGTVKAKGSGANVNCALRTLRRILSLAEEWNLLARRPKISLADEIKRERLIRPDEEIKFLAKANPTMRGVFLLMMDTGARPSEVAALEWKYVDFGNGTIFVASGKTPKARRFLAMTSRVREMLIARASLSNTWVFPSPRSEGHIKAKSISVMGSAIKKELGLPADVVLYCARHTFATDYQSGSGDLAKTSRTLGHAAISTTQRYLHPDTSNQASIMDARNAAREVEGHNFGHSKVAVQ
jgi:integrase